MNSEEESLAGLTPGPVGPNTIDKASFPASCYHMTGLDKQQCYDSLGIAIVA